MGLYNHKDFLDNMVDSFAAVLDLDLTIINAGPMERISGTGIYKTSANGWRQSYTEKVIQSGEPKIVLDASRGEDDTVTYAPYYSIMLYPILSGGIVEGVIVLGSSTKKQHQRFMQKQKQLFLYLEKTAALISAKLEQEKLLERAVCINNQLTTIIESVQGGLVLYSLEDGIVRINHNARSILRAERPNIHSVLMGEIVKSVKLAQEKGEGIKAEILQVIDHTPCSIMVQVLPVDKSKNMFLCIVNHFENIQNMIMQNTGGVADGRDEIIAGSQSMQMLKTRVSQVADYPSNVLILGESGTGKELFARMLHAKSSRSKYPFVSINCAAIPETLLESELFGYEDGAFTGAKKGGYIGKFMLANKGTLFLDEIGDMPLYMQSKLLRVLSDRKIDRIGGSKPVEVDVRIIAATNKNLEEMVHKKEFREDLYYRLNVIPFFIPPLRERKEDILLLAKHFIDKYNQKLGKHVNWLSSQAQELLISYDWPGNVRELENSVEYMVAFEETDRIQTSSAPTKLQEFYHSLGRAAEYASSLPLSPGAQTAGKLSPGPSSGADFFSSPSKEQLNRPLKQQLNDFEIFVINFLKKQYGGASSAEQVKAICDILDISVATYYRKLNGDKAKYQSPTS